LLERRDRPFDAEATVVDVPDVMRYVATARRTLRGPLVLEIEGPGDPLASPESVLRVLSLVREHHPDVLTGLVIDGPLLGEYTEELAEFDLGYVVLRLDAATPRTAHRLVAGARYRGEALGRPEAATLYLEESRRALDLARRRGLPLAVRTTVIPTVNAHEIGAIASLASRRGAERMDLVPHEPRADAPLAPVGAPTAAEMRVARAAVAGAFVDAPRRHRGPRITDWLHPGRFQPVSLDRLEAVDVLRTLPEPDGDETPGRVLPPRRAQIVAVASRDGTLVDETLAAAPYLRLYAVTERAIRAVGVRPLEQDLRRRHDGVGDAHTFLRAVVGCRSVVATGFSGRAVTLLRAVGIQPVALGGLVEDVLDRVARGTIRQAT
jgi:nitrogen fixation protein NifB